MLSKNQYNKIQFSSDVFHTSHFVSPKIKMFIWNLKFITTETIKTYKKGGGILKPHKTLPSCHLLSDASRKILL